MKIISRQSSLLQILLTCTLIMNIFVNVNTEKIGSNFSLSKSNLLKTKSKAQSKKVGPASDASVHTGFLITDSPQIVNANVGPTPIKPLTQDIPDRLIYHQGWIKYFRYMDIEGGKKPNRFFRNEEFYKQKNSNNTESDSSTGDIYGPNKIPDDKHFFGVIYKDGMNILSSRANTITQVIDTVTIDFIKTIPEDDNYVGGIKNFGSFSEGSCFEVRTTRPATFFQMSADFTEPKSGIKEIWLICTDREEDKTQFMNILIKLKLKKQHAFGNFIYARSDPNKKNDNLSPALNGISIADYTNGKNIDKPINDPKRDVLRDGYWMLLQDWSSCTLKCGGGLQYQQLMCVPPKAGGKPCDGPAVRTKPCNPHPCPSVNFMKNMMPVSGKKETIEKPIIKMMAISQRPQRYDKCYLKEGDALMVKQDATGSFETLPKIPIRIVMNNKSITIYQDDTMQTQLMVFLLETSVFVRVKDNTRCFILNSNNKRAQFCQIDGSASQNFLEEWDYDFNLFKNQCHEKRKTYEINSLEEAKLKKEYEKKVNKVKAEIVQEKANKLKEITEKNEELKFEKKIEATQTMTLMALQKETKLEEMLEREELDKEVYEQQELNLKLETEKKKDECLMKSIREKQLEDQNNLTKANAESEIEKIKEEAKKQIEVRRALLKRKIDAMKKRSARKKQQINNSIQTLRVEVAGKMSKITKAGDMKKCFAGTDTLVTQIEEYCSTNFYDNAAKFVDCKNIENFCFTCCENEYGDLHGTERETCYKSQCDPLSTT